MMDDGLVDSARVRAAESNAFNAGCEAASGKLKSYVESIKDWLKNLAEDRTLPMDVKVHELLWQQIQSIEHDVQTNFEEVKA